MTGKRTPESPVRVIVIEATRDASYRHKCGAMVSPRFNGIVAKCPLCREAT